jgi:hypothetical protein
MGVLNLQSEIGNLQSAILHSLPLLNPLWLAYRVTRKSFEFYSSERTENIPNPVGEVRLLFRGPRQNVLQNFARLPFHGAPVRGGTDFQLALGVFVQVSDDDAWHVINDSTTINDCIGGRQRFDPLRLVRSVARRVTPLSSSILLILNDLRSSDRNHPCP